MAKIIIRDDFTKTPGGRWKKLGPYSGEEFFDTILETKYIEAREKNEELFIDLDGVTGYPSSFRDQSFGELGRKYGGEEVLKICKFKSEDTPSYIEDMKRTVLGEK